MKKQLAVAALALFAVSAQASESVTLYAGKTAVAGQVMVATVGTNLTVTYMLANGWVMSESHLDVACSLAQIPQKNGNPPPGQFPFSATHNPPVTTFTYTIPLTNPNLAGCHAANNTVYIAAHAVVGNGATTTYVVSSPSNTVITRRRSGNDPTPFLSTAPINQPAVAAWTPCAQNPNCPDGSNSIPPDTPYPSLWDTALLPNGIATTLHNAGAVWIWESKFTNNAADPNGAVHGAVVRMETNFNLPALPSSGSLTVACDNGYEAFVNGTSVGVSAEVRGAWKDSTL